MLKARAMRKSTLALLAVAALPLVPCIGYYFGRFVHSPPDDPRQHSTSVVERDADYRKPSALETEPEYAPGKTGVYSPRATLPIKESKPQTGSSEPSSFLLQVAQTEEDRAKERRVNQILRQRERAIMELADQLEDRIRAANNCPPTDNINTLLPFAIQQLYSQADELASGIFASSPQRLEGEIRQMNEDQLAVPPNFQPQHYTKRVPLTSRYAEALARERCLGKEYRGAFTTLYKFRMALYHGECDNARALVMPITSQFPRLTEVISKGIERQCPRPLREYDPSPPKIIH